MRRVALIGAGGIGSVHASCYPDIADAELVAVMDIRPEVASALAEKYGAVAYSDAEKLFREVDFDTIDICTPTPFHIDYIRMGSAEGKAICCEKPFCRTTEECKEAIRICAKANVTLFVAHVLRWFPEFRRAKQLIESGAIGTPSVARTSRMSGYPRSAWQDWFANVELSGGVVLDLSIHDIDWLLWALGPADRVFSRGLTYTDTGDVRDYALTTIRFKNGAIAHVESSWATPIGFHVDFEVAGDKGLLDFSNDKSPSLRTASWGSDLRTSTVPSIESPTGESPYLLELRHFIDCLETGKPTEVTPKQAMDAVTVCLAVLESIKTGEPVKV